MSMNVLQWFNPARAFHRLTHLTKAEWRSLGLKVLALALAVLLHVISRQPLRDMRVVGVPVEFGSLKPGVELLTDNVPPTVSLRVRGPSDVLRDLVPNQLSVLVNLGNKEPGERVVQLKPRDVLAPPGVEVLQIEPASISLSLDQTERKLVKVEPQFSGTPAEGIELYSITVTPSMLEIEGPQSRLRALNEVKTESISLQGQRHSFTTTVEAELPVPLLRVTNRTPLTLAVALGERRATRLFSNLPVQMIGQSGRARLLTKTVEVLVAGSPAALENLRDSDLNVELELPPNAARARPRVRLPESLAAQVEVKSIKPNEIKVTK